MDKDRKRNIIYKRNLQRKKENAMKIQDKLNIWVKLTNVNPTEEQKSYTINMSGRLSDFDIKRMNDKIKEALKYDATGVFADAYLSEYFEKFIADKNFSVKEMLANPEIENFLADARLLQDALTESDSANMIRSDAEKAMNFYGMSAEELSLSDIIEVRTSAERCMNGKLSILQFSSGTPSENGFKMSKDIYMYRDLDAMLYCAADNVLDGVSLGYIRNEGNLTDSYFAFIIKNGRNLYLLTDKPKYGHPLMSSYRHSRCPGRDMSRRRPGLFKISSGIFVLPISCKRAAAISFLTLSYSIPYNRPNVPAYMATFKLCMYVELSYAAREFIFIDILSACFSEASISPDRYVHLSMSMSLSAHIALSCTSAGI